jgi:sugar lactone lactonase YvrE
MSRKSVLVIASGTTLALFFLCAIPLLAQSEPQSQPQGQFPNHCIAGSPQPVFTAPPGEDTECPAVLHNGDVLTAEMYSGKIYRIKPNGEAVVIATLFPAGTYPYLQVVGTLLTRNGDLLVLANTWDPSTHGVWRVHPNGEFELYAAIPPDGSFLNAMTFDDRGNLFVTDSTLGAIWKVSHRGEVELWCSGDLLIWRDDPTGPFGANGIAFWRDTLYVAVTDAGAGLLPDLRGQNYPVVKIPILHGGSAGRPEVFLTADILVPDGLAVDQFGNLYVVDFGGLLWGPGFPLTGPARLLRFRLPEGTNEEVLASAGLQNSASVVIRNLTAYVTNLYVTDVPNIVKINLCAKVSHRDEDSEKNEH